MPRIALYQPDIPHNTGAILRFAACLGVGVDIIEPAGFDLSDRGLKRAGMDYVERAALTRHVSFETFENGRRAAGARLILFSTRAERSYLDFTYRADDVLLFGRESAGVPEHVHSQADQRLIVPMRPGLRSINLAMTVAMVTGEALRQTHGLPELTAVRKENENDVA
ncbi:tRNA (cytidine(34)-2'-O)-methyltransferase [Kaistia dalseonensis]|uniref:tRNA (cytidine(34)-2'-O)-methyltransferase n=1 Tax=Kaistia dalseonensis TaxID=410840 RepID=A0ABU0H7M6_9HYPH|nr:tRNA (cytidine(34)-2'-O)-methyltransferase [Kaistia dalseonensis]MCX5495200.1 tRNA (cytidine(34)-2'-O)-methyltransferase [Kaistia dalseonensis]MDQ0437785.1 tRNA (cytidine/uridine-2'-O-)-methyltransferase [Kaistia dalseonensis]